MLNKQNEKKSLLSQVAVATPCAVPWETMQGDEQTRACDQCKLKVYNLSAMSKDEAEAFLRQKKNGRRCIRFYRRADGTILTDDCPVGLRRLRDASKRCIAFLTPLVSLLLCALPARAQVATQQRVVKPTAASHLLRGLIRCNSNENAKTGGSDDQNTLEGFLRGDQSLTSAHRIGWVYGDEGSPVDIDALKTEIESGRGTEFEREANRALLAEAQRNYLQTLQAQVKPNFDVGKLIEVDKVIKKIEPTQTDWIKPAAQQKLDPDRRVEKAP